MLHDLAVEQSANKSNDEYYKEMITELCTDREIETLIGGTNCICSIIGNCGIEILKVFTNFINCLITNQIHGN